MGLAQKGSLTGGKSLRNQTYLHQYFLSVDSLCSEDPFLNRRVYLEYLCFKLQWHRVGKEGLR